MTKDYHIIGSANALYNNADGDEQYINQSNFVDSLDTIVIGKTWLKFDPY